jgi:hypothetical protein
MAAGRRDGQARTMTVTVQECGESAAVASPPGARPARGTESTAAGQPRRCASPSCGRPLEPRPTGRPARYCSGKCRQAGKRARARAAADPQFRDAAVTEPPEYAPRAARHGPASVSEIVERERRRPGADKLRSNRQDLLRRAAHDLLRVLDQAAGPDEAETRETLRDVAAAIDLRRDEWPPE